MTKAVWAWVWLVQRLFRYDPVTGLRIHRDSCRKFGNGDGAWWVPQAVLRKNMHVVSAGLGRDARFEEALSAAVNPVIQMLDPTPSVLSYGEDVARRLENVHFQGFGLWCRDETKWFHGPKDPSHVSHSLTALQGERPAVQVKCRRLSTLLKDWNWEAPDLLKMDIEGAEYEVLEDVLSSGIPVRAICFEFDETHTPQDAEWRLRIRQAASRLTDAGYRLVHVVPKGDYTFLSSE